MRIEPLAGARPSPEILERVEAALAQGAVGLSFTAADGTCEYVSPALEKIVGVRPDEMMGQRQYTRTHSDDLPEARQKWETLLREPGESRVFLTRVATKHIGERWIESTVTNLLHEPSVRSVLAIFRDVTDRELSRVALAETSRRFESLLSATSAVTYSCTVSPPFGATFVTDNIANVLGYRPQQFIDDPAFWAERIHPDERTAVLADLARVFTEGRHVHEYRFLHADGTYRWLHDALVLVRDGDGTPRELIGCFYDVTARHETELAIARSEANFRALIESAPLAVVVHRDDEVLYANPAMVALLGYDSPKELVGQSPFSLIVPASREAAKLRSAQLIAAPGVATTPLAEGAMLRRDGTEVAIEVEGIKLDFDGAPACVVLARDLTERRVMLAQISLADRLASVGTLAAGVAHEINNPLAYVLVNLATLSEVLPSLLRGGARLESAEVETLLREACDGAIRIQSLVRDLRAVAHPDHETTTEVDVRAAIDGCIRIAQNEIRHRARLTTRFASAPTIRANSSRIGQIVLNLLINAAHAIPEGDIAANEVKVSLSTAPGGVVIEVADTGTGIPKEILGRIFDPFFTTKPVGDGTGMGLTICHALVKAMKGDITVESNVPRGTTFRVFLPVSDQAPRTAEPQVVSAPALERMRVLVIDDEPLIGRSLEIFWRDSYDVVFVTRAADALARLNEESFDVILCDLMMPEMTGMQFYETLSGAKPDTARRIVFLTGGAFTPAARAFLDRVPNPHAQKPFDFVALNAAMRVARESGAARRPAEKGGEAR
jgi:PAS domain S-box-containing protein